MSYFDGLMRSHRSHHALAALIFAISCVAGAATNISHNDDTASDVQPAFAAVSSSSDNGSTYVKQLLPVNSSSTPASTTNVPDVDVLHSRSLLAAPLLALPVISMGGPGFAVKLSAALVKLGISIAPLFEGNGCHENDLAKHVQEKVDEGFQWVMCCNYYKCDFRGNGKYDNDDTVSRCTWGVRAFKCYMGYADGSKQRMKRNGYTTPDRFLAVGLVESSGDYVYAGDIWAPDGYTCFSGQTQKSGPYLRQTFKNSRLGCAAACDADTDCEAFDVTLNTVDSYGNDQLDACRLVGSGQTPRRGDAGKDGRVYCYKE